MTLTEVVATLDAMILEYERLLPTVHEAEEKLRREIADPEAWQPSPYDLGAVAFIVVNVYVGVERMLTYIAKQIDGFVPSDPSWHRTLLTQMSQPRLGRRPPVLREETVAELSPFLAFRHVQRNIYTFDLQWPSLAQLLQDAPQTVLLVTEDLPAFVDVIQDVGGVPDAN